MFTVANISEWDIKSCDISVLYLIGVITKDEQERLRGLPKLERNIHCGNLQKYDKTIYPRMNTEREKIVNEFIQANGLENSIFQVVKDAVWVRNKRPNILTFRDGEITFVNKNSATSIFGYKNKFFYNDSIRGRIFTRGFGDISSKEFPILNIVRKFMTLKENRLEKESYEFIHRAFRDYDSLCLERDAYKSLINGTEFNRELLQALILEL